MAHALLLKRPLPLAYPGTAPGFDPSHVASKLVRYSGTAVGSLGIIDLLTGTTVTAFETPPTKNIDALLGPNNLIGGGGAWITVVPPLLDVACTIGAIIRPTTISGATRYGIYGTGVAAGGYALAYQSGNLVFENLDSSNNNTSSSPIAIAVGVPYFVAASFSGVSGGPINYVVRNLNTGQVFFFASTFTQGVTAASDGSGAIGSDGDNLNFMIGKIATAMHSGAYMSKTQLLQWANDPWSFWFPRTLDLTMMMTPSAPSTVALTGKIGWAVQGASAFATPFKLAMAATARIANRGSVTTSGKVAITGQLGSQIKAQAGLFNAFGLFGQMGSRIRGAAGIAGKTPLVGRAGTSFRGAAGTSGKTAIAGRLGSTVRASGVTTGNVQLLAASAAIMVGGRGAQSGTVGMFGRAGVHMSAAAGIAGVAGLGPQVGYFQGFLFHPGAGPTWELRARGAFPVTPVTILFGGALIRARGGGTMTLTASLTGQTSTKTSGLSALGAKAALAARWGFRFKAQATAMPAALLAAKSALQAKGSAGGPIALASLAARASSAVFGAAGLSKAVVMIARMGIQTTGRLSPPTGKVSLAAVTRIMASIRLSTPGAIALLGNAAVKFAGRLAAPTGKVPLRAMNTLTLTASPGIKGAAALGGKASIAARARGAITGTTSLFGQAVVQIKGIGAKTLGTRLAARMGISSTGSLAPPTGTVGLAGGMNIASSAAGLLSGVTRLVATLGRIGAAVFGGGTITTQNVFPTPRMVLPDGPARTVAAMNVPLRLQWPTKHPDEDLDYGVTYGARLNAPPAIPGDTIVSSHWSIVDAPDSALVIGQQINGGTFTIVWLSGGTERQVYELLNEIETKQGRTMSETVFLFVQTLPMPDFPDG